MSLVPIADILGSVELPSGFRTALHSLRPNRHAGTGKVAMQAAMQGVAQMLMRDVPGLAGVVQHRGDQLPSWPYHLLQYIEGHITF